MTPSSLLGDEGQCAPPLFAQATKCSSASARVREGSLRLMHLCAPSEPSRLGSGWPIPVSSSRPRPKELELKRFLGSVNRRRVSAVIFSTLIASVAGIPGLGAVPAAHADTLSLGYPLGGCQANLVEASAVPGESSSGTIALSLGGGPATADDCFDDGYSNSGVAVTTGSSASSSIAAIALTSCYSVGDYASVVGGGVTQCGRGFLANVSVFGDAYGYDSFGNQDGYVSFSLLGDASGSFLAVAPFGSASGQAAVGCTAADGAADVSWRWCSAWDSALTPAERQAVYSTLAALWELGLVETQAVLNFYSGVMVPAGAGWNCSVGGATAFLTALVSNPSTARAAAAAIIGCIGAIALGALPS